jgi:hypothetical protein
LFSLPGYGKGIYTRSKKIPERAGPGIFECRPDTRQVAIDDGRNLDLSSGDILFDLFPLAGEALQGMDIGWREIDIIQLLGINEWHFGHSEGIEAVALNWTSEVLSQGSYLLSFGLNQMAVRMMGSEVNGNHEPGQSRWFEDDDGIGTVSENVFF